MFEIMKIDPFPQVLTARYIEKPYITKKGNKGIQRVKAFVLTDEQEAKRRESLKRSWCLRRAKERRKKNELLS